MTQTLCQYCAKRVSGSAKISHIPHPMNLCFRVDVGQTWQYILSKVKLEAMLEVPVQTKHLSQLRKVTKKDACSKSPNVVGLYID